MFGLQFEAAAYTDVWLRTGRSLSVRLLAEEKAARESQIAHLRQKRALIGYDLRLIWLLET